MPEKETAQEKDHIYVYIERDVLSVYTKYPDFHHLLCYNL